MLLLKAREIWGNEMPNYNAKADLISFLVIAAQAFIENAAFGRILIFLN
jgi:hypothetical protein